MDTEPYKVATINSPNGTREFYYRPGTSDEPALTQIFQNQEYSVQRLRRGGEIQQFIDARHNSGRRPLIIDAGANIGASAVFFALTFPAAVIVAIEPEESNFALLRRNVDGLDVRCLQAGLSSSAGHLRVSDPGQGHWGYRTEPAAEEAGVPCVTVSQIYQRECRPDIFPFIVKIDIEGAEADVFDSNTAWLAQTPIVMIELHDWLLPKSGTSRPFLQCIAGQPRDFIMVGENIFSISHSLN
jgi:FkbM family methyltransferase